MKAKRRAGPEQTETAQPVDREMSNSGFNITRLSRTVHTEGRFYSGVTTGTPDRYYWRESGLSLWVELKRPKGGRASAAQQRFYLGHALNPCKCHIWHDVRVCVAWLEARGYRMLRDGQPYYPYGIHALGSIATEAETWEC
jgi:hypothetical protein